MHLSSALCLPLRLIWGIAPRILRCALFFPPPSHRTKEERRLSRSRLTAVTQSVRVRCTSTFVHRRTETNAEKTNKRRARVFFSTPPDNQNAVLSTLFPAVVV